MKKIQVMIGIIFAAVFLSACAQKEPDSSSLQFPGLKWGMNKEEAFQAAGIKEEDLADYSSEARFGSAYIVEGYEAFGEESYRTNFCFLDVGDGVPS